MQNLRSKFQKLRRNRRFFLACFTIAMGLPISAVDIWYLGRHVGVSFSVFIVIVSFLAALLGAYAMWKYFTWCYHWDDSEQ